MAVEKDKSSTPNVHVGQADIPKKKYRLGLTRKKVLVTAIVVIILGVTAYIIIHKSATKSVTQGNSEISQAQKQLESRGIKWSNLNASQQLQYLVDQHQYYGAEQLLQGQLQYASNGDKANTYLQQASVATQFKHYSDTRNYINKAKQLSPQSSAPYVAFAQLAQKQGEKTKAEQYWRQAIARINPNQAGANLIKQDYQRSLNELSK